MRTIETKLFLFEELSDKAKKKAIENRREEMYNCDSFLNWCIDDCYLLEPPHKELEKLYKTLKIESKDILIKNNRKIYVDLYYNTIDISEAMEIQNNYIFLKWLGLNDRLISKITFEIGKDTINIDLDDYKDCNLTKIEEDKIDKAVEKFEQHCINIFNNINESYEYYHSDECIIDDLIINLYEFTENGKIHE